MGSQRETVDADTITGGFSGIVEAGVGATTGDVNGVGKKLDGDIDGEDSGDSNEDADGGIEDGDVYNGELYGAETGENGDCDLDGSK